MSVGTIGPENMTFLDICEDLKIDPRRIKKMLRCEGVAIDAIKKCQQQLLRYHPDLDPDLSVNLDSVRAY